MTFKYHNIAEWKRHAGLCFIVNGVTTLVLLTRCSLIIVDQHISKRKLDSGSNVQKLLLPNCRDMMFQWAILLQTPVLVTLAGNISESF